MLLLVMVMLWSIVTRTWDKICFHKLSVFTKTTIPVQHVHMLGVLMREGLNFLLSAWSGYGHFFEITLLVFSLYKKYKFCKGSMPFT